MIFKFSDLSSHDSHKLMISTIVPRPIAWVSTMDVDGQMNAAPFSFFNVFSDEPPLVILGIGSDERPGGSGKDSGRNIRERGEFVVNLVDRDTVQAMTKTAVNFPPSVNEMEKAGLSTAPSAVISTPRIAQSPVSIECRTDRIVELPSKRLLVLGLAVAMHVRDDAVLDAERCYIDTPKLNLVARMHGRGWYIATTDWFQEVTPEPF